jgi:hypothetical protein
VSLIGALQENESEYERLAEWHAERTPFDDEHVVGCQAMIIIGIVLREVAEALRAGR